MRDGTYIVETPYLNASFTILEGKMIGCAPILRKKISYWKTQARWICEVTEADCLTSE